MKVEYWENPCGGVGKMKIEKILDADILKDKNGLYARVTLPPGASLGHHEHHGNGESYFILSGEGAYEDNGTVRTVKPGDVTWTPDGSGHGISNVEGKEDLVFIALIVNS